MQQVTYLYELHLDGLSGFNPDKVKVGLMMIIMLLNGNYDYPIIIIILSPLSDFQPCKALFGVSESFKGWQLPPSEQLC